MYTNFSIKENTKIEKLVLRTEHYEWIYNFSYKKLRSQKMGFTVNLNTKSGFSLTNDKNYPNTILKKVKSPMHNWLHYLPWYYLMYIMLDTVHKLYLSGTLRVPHTTNVAIQVSFWDTKIMQVWFGLVSVDLMTSGLSKDHLVSCRTIPFLNLQITRSDIRTHKKWAVSLVIAYGHFNHPPGFVLVCMG